MIARWFTKENTTMGNGAESYEALDYSIMNRAVRAFLYDGRFPADVPHEYLVTVRQAYQPGMTLRELVEEVENRLFPEHKDF